MAVALSLTPTVPPATPFLSRLATPPPGRERYQVPGGGSIWIGLQAGDRLTLLDPEGAQPCEILVFDETGKSDANLLNASDLPPAREALLQLAADPNAARLRKRLQATVADRGHLRGVRLFAPDSEPGLRRELRAAVACNCILVSVGGAMPIEGAVAGHRPATELIAFVDREHPIEVPNPLESLPEPLAEARLDLRIQARTAHAYLVRAGEYIQVMDIAGHQCSDFLAFAHAPLEAGRENSLDATATRSLMGFTCPQPGLYSKFYDQDLNPLLEVVRDTCGRHDTFGLACYARFYEERGYFGHPNCSDNFNAALRDYGVRARPAWPAVNFFYNTGIDDSNSIYLDESWSRPGDYVLLRALTDLVCSSSACPDDIDPANGWNPTDVQVRVYPSRHMFSKAVAFRLHPDSETRMTRETAFHPRSSALTRRFTEYRGYWLPTSYQEYGTIEEYHACRERVAVMDLSPLRKFEVFGPDAEALMQWSITRDVRRLAVGQVVYSAMCYPSGGMLDDGTLFRLGADNFRWICGEEYGGDWLRKQAKEKKYRVWVKSSTDQLHNIAVQGPRSRELLRELIWTPPAQPTLEELQWFRFTIGRLGDLKGVPLMISRTGYTGELGYELWCHPDAAVEVWDALWKAGQPLGLAPLGLEALDMLRIEAGLVFAGYEFCDQTDPFEAGIGFCVPLRGKQDDFVGRAALEKRKAHPQRRLVGLELEGNEAAGHGDCVHQGRAQTGVVTSAVRSPVLRRNIALCRMDVSAAEEGAAVEVGKLDGHQKRIPARVVPIPFYDPRKERVRA